MVQGGNWTFCGWRCLFSDHFSVLVWEWNELICLQIFKMALFKSSGYIRIYIILLKEHFGFSQMKISFPNQTIPLNKWVQMLFQSEFNSLEILFHWENRPYKLHSMCHSTSCPQRWWYWKTAVVWELFRAVFLKPQVMEGWLCRLCFPFFQNSTQGSYDLASFHLWIISLLGSKFILLPLLYLFLLE